MKQTTSEFLRERLLINTNGTVLSTIDEVIEVCKLFTQSKCKEQRRNCAIDIDFVFTEETDEVASVDMNSILNAKQPIL